MNIADYTGIATLLATFLLGGGLAWLRLYIRDILQDHERADERRHRQNLSRFSWVAVQIARLGGKNGDMPTFDD